ncbi:MAG: stress response protein, partial [Propionibacteriaceae bacterium]|nr:stress response protein [Propionibacteriaceae bacterium]
MAVVKPVEKSTLKPQEAWHQARLIPTTGIGGQDEQERRATSSLLAVMRAVPQFGRAVLFHLGAPAGRIDTFIEVRFLDADDKTVIPDGAVVVERGKTRWVCLVEVKTAGAALRPDQVERYLDIARAKGFDAVLTLSNQITASPAESPIAVDPKKTKKVALRHLSWWQVMTEARVQHEHRGIADTEQAWILGELIAYLDHEKAGAGGFDDMGDAWVSVRDGARQHSLRLADKGVRDVASRWEQFVQYLALGLCQTLGRNVEVAWPKKLDPAERLNESVRLIVEQGQLAAVVRVPDAAAPMELSADLRTRLFITSVEIPAPREGRAKTRINWMIRQLKDAPDNLRIETRYPNAKETVSATIKQAREKPEMLLFAADPQREPRGFRLLLGREMGSKRGKVAGSFVNESKAQAIDFYRTIVQGLRPWSASAPKLPGQVEPASA